MDKLDRVLGYITSTPDQDTIAEFDNKIPRACIDASHGIHEKDCESPSETSLVLRTSGLSSITSVTQAIVTKSSTTTELDALSDVASEVICLCNLSIDQGYSTSSATVHQDYNSTVSLVKNGGSCSNRSRHIDIRHSLMTEQVADDSITVVQYPTEVIQPVTGLQLVLERQGLTNWFD
jgi:hypothetical protein